MADNKQSPHAWLIFLIGSPILAILGVLAIMDPDPDSGPPQWPFSSDALGIFALATAALFLFMAVWTRIKR